MRSYSWILSVALSLFGATLVACSSTRDQAIPVAVTVEIDYGPADRPRESSRQMVPRGSSPADALLQIKPVVQGHVCCTREDIWAVDGVETSYEESLYWVWLLNGQRQDLAPDRYVIQNGDFVTWRYERTELPQHRRR